MEVGDLEIVRRFGAAGLDDGHHARGDAVRALDLHPGFELIGAQPRAVRARPRVIVGRVELGVGHTGTFTRPNDGICNSDAMYAPWQEKGWFASAAKSRARACDRLVAVLPVSRQTNFAK